MGIGCEPASATTLAGLEKLRSAGVVKPDDRVVCVLTGNILKDPDSIMQSPSLRQQVVEIDADVRQVARALESRM